MRSTNSVVIRVEGPSKGLLTRFPSDLQDDGKIKYLVAAENVRAEKNQLRAAPGYERIATPLRALNGVPNLIYQANLTGVDSDQKHTPVIGTETELLVMDRRAKELSCTLETGQPILGWDYRRPGTPTCSLRFVATGNGGVAGTPLDNLSAVLQQFDPKAVLYAGNLTSSASINTQDSVYDATIYKKYGWSMAKYGLAPDYKVQSNRFFPVPGPLDYTDATILRFAQSFPVAYWLFTYSGTLIPAYTVKRGPVQFFFIDSVGPQTGAASGVGQSNLSSTGPQAQWLQAQLANSDCPWRVVVWHHPPASSASSGGYSVMDWPLGTWGADVLITGALGIYERITRTDGVIHFNVGSGGRALGTLAGSAVTGSQYRNNTAYVGLLVDADQNKFVASAYTSEKVLVDTTTLTSSRTLAQCYVEGSDLLGSVQSLEVRPKTIKMAQDQVSQLRAYATIAGTLLDVTNQCTWNSADSSKVAVDFGKITGSGITSGVSVTATIQGISSSANVQVVAKDPQKVYFSLVLDLSGSMNSGETATGPLAAPRTRLERMKEAVSIFLDSLQAEDKAALTVYHDQAELLVRLTGSIQTIKDQLPGLMAFGNTNTSDGLRLAQEAFSAVATTDTQKFEIGFNHDSNSTDDPRPTIVLFTDGMANAYMSGDAVVIDNNASPTDNVGMIRANTEVTDLIGPGGGQTSGYNLIVIGFDVKRNATLEAQVKQWALKAPWSEFYNSYVTQRCARFYYSVDDLDDLIAVFTKLRSELSTSDGCGVTGVPGIP